MTDQPFPHLSAAAIREMEESVNVHQFNARAVRHTRSLSDALGLTTLGVHLVRVCPGDETTQFHFHHQDEEFIYILSGTGVAEIGDQEIPVAAGDFMAFARQSLPHNMRNTADEDLVYLMGGTRSDIDICDYPRINRRMYRVDGRKHFLDLDDVEPL